jgi:hypothetical protein
LIPLEIRVVSAEEQALQPLSIRQDRLWNSLPLGGEKIGQPVDGDDNVPVEHRVVPGQFGVAYL